MNRPGGRNGRSCGVFIMGAELLLGARKRRQGRMLLGISRAPRRDSLDAQHGLEFAKRTVGYERVRPAGAYEPKPHANCELVSPRITSEIAVHHAAASGEACVAKCERHVISDGRESRGSDDTRVAVISLDGDIFEERARCAVRKSERISSGRDCKCASLSPGSFESVGISHL